MKKHSLLALSILSLLGGCINPYLYQDRPAPVLNLGNFRTDTPTEQPTEPQPQAPEAATEDSWSNPPSPINAEEDNPYAPITPPQKQPDEAHRTGDVTAPTLQKERPVRPPERPIRPEPSEERPTRPAPSEHHDAPWNSKPSETRPAPRPEPPSPAERPAPSRPVTPVPPPAEPSTQETPPATPQAAANPVNYMILQAQKAVSKHDLESAAAYLENAQRIAPNNAKILYDIANIRYHQGRYSDAETFASRAVNVGGNARMMKKSWALIAKARKSRGDNQGAVAAAEKASTY